MYRSSLQCAERDCDCEGAYSVYVIQDMGGNRTYIGKTNDLRRRIRQHNGEISGGARATRGRTWKYIAVIRGFDCNQHAMQAEWRMKHEHRRVRQLSRVFEKVSSESFMIGKGWTSNSPSPDNQWLCVLTDLMILPPDGWPIYWGWQPLSETDEESRYVVPSSHTELEAAED